jgi:hypothetical protein
VSESGYSPLARCGDRAALPAAHDAGDRHVVRSIGALDIGQSERPVAGAGVFGMAVGFGAQTLVPDVISDVFFPIEDVFRIGEYIESGINLTSSPP